MTFSLFDKKHTVHGAKFYLASRKELFGLFLSMRAFRHTGTVCITGALTEGEDFRFNLENGSVDGHFLEVIPEQKIVMIWNVYDHKGEEERNTIVQLEFSEENGMALLYLKHSGIKGKESKRSKIKFWQKFLEGLDEDLEQVEQRLTF